MSRETHATHCFVQPSSDLCIGPYNAAVAKLVVAQTHVFPFKTFHSRILMAVSAGSGK